MNAEKLGDVLRCICYVFWASAALAIIYTELTLPGVIERAVELSAVPGRSL